MTLWGIRQEEGMTGKRGISQARIKVEYGGGSSYQIVPLIDSPESPL
jgi:hypothetical protein